ncbi:MAG: DNA-directed RNA polymerase subunit omega [Pseudomonadota bacterium]
MARVTVEDCLKKVDNRFALVHLVAKRAKQLLKGSQPVITKVKNKFVVTSLREVAHGLVQFDNEQSTLGPENQDPTDNIH